MLYAGDNGSLAVTVDDNSTLVPEDPKHSEVVLLLTTSGQMLGVTSIVLNVVFLSAMRFVDDSSTAYHRLMQVCTDDCFH